MSTLMSTLWPPLADGRKHRAAQKIASTRCTPAADGVIGLDRVLALLDSTPLPAVVSAAVDVAHGRVRIELEAPRRTADQDGIGADLGALLLAEPGVTSVSITFLSLDLAGRWVDASN